MKWFKHRRTGKSSKTLVSQEPELQYIPMKSKQNQEQKLENLRKLIDEKDKRILELLEEISEIARRLKEDGKGK